MIDTKELRQLAQAATPGPWFSDARGNIWRRPLSDLYENGGSVAGDKPIAFVAAGWRGEGVTGYPVENNARLIAASNPSAVIELLDRLEAAEADALEQARLNGMGASREAALMAKLEAAEKERDELRNEIACVKEVEFPRKAQAVADAWKGKCERLEAERDALRARIEAMEQQEPVAQVGVHKTGGNAGIMWSARPLNEFDSLPLLRDGDRLYLAPGAQPAQMVVAYLDLGVGGYMDIGTDLTDEALATLPKGRHMLGIIGTYGVDGYVQAQPAPSVPDGFSREDLEAVADGLDGYEKTVNVGNVTGEGDDHLESTTAYAARFIRTMLAAAPEAKP